jgi:signal transduction histidine kinase
MDDITERVQIEHALKESDKQKNQFISVVSHDIRSKLTEMTSAVMLLNRSNSNNQNDKNTTLYIDLLKSALDNSLEMLDELLQWGGMITGRAQFTYQKFNPIRVIEKTEEFLEDSLIKKNIQLRIEHPDNIVIHADKTMFSVLIRNLIANAIKFSHKDKTIKVIGKKITKRISVERISQESYVEYCIKDNGVGIEPDKLETLFTNLKKKSTPGTSGEKGTGLGLMLCKEIVEKHNGKIWVASEPGNGSSFYFQIPETQIN